MMPDEYLKAEVCRIEKKLKNRDSKLDPRPMPVFPHPTHRTVNLDDVCKIESICLSLSSSAGAECHTLDTSGSQDSRSPAGGCAMPAQPVVPSPTVAGGAGRRLKCFTAATADVSGYSCWQKLCPRHG